MASVRIMHLIDGLTTGGAEVMLCKLVTRVDRARFENTVVSFMDEGPVKGAIEEAGIPVTTLGVPRGRLSPAGLARLIRLLAAERPTVLHTWSKTADLVGLVAGRALGVQNVVWNIRGSSRLRSQCSRTTRLCDRACALLSQSPTMVLTNSEAGLMAHVRKGYRPKRWQIIPNGFDLDAFWPDQDTRREVRRELGIPQEAIVIGTAGRYHPVKDLATFVRAVSLAAARHDRWHFVMAGTALTPGNAELLGAVRGTEAEGRLHLLGERNDMPRVLAALDVFTLTSLSEGFPNVVGEAMACAIPCIVTETAGDAPTIVGETGVVVPARDPDALGAAWERMFAASDQVRAAFGQAARQRVHDKYSLGAVVREYEDLYTSLAAGTARTGGSHRSGSGAYPPRHAHRLR